MKALLVWRFVRVQSWAPAAGVCALLALAAGCGTAVGASAEADAGGDAATPFVLTTDDPWAGQTSGATARFDLAAKDWHATPFPTNTRMAADGNLDLSGFPAAADGSEQPGTLTDYLTFADAHLHGWSLQPTLYAQFDAALPADAFGPPTTKPTFSKFFLVDVDPKSPDYGALVPLTSRFSGNQVATYLAKNLLEAQPVWGWPLRPQTTYAFVILRGLRDAGGQVLGRPAALADVIDARFVTKDPAKLDAPRAAWAKALEPLFVAMEAGKVPVQPLDIAAATVLTTGNPTHDLQVMAQWVQKHAATPAATGFERIKADDPDYVLASAHYMAPNFQRGNCPYDNPGEGGFDLSADGSPTVQRWEDIRVSMVLPKQPFVLPDGTVPVVLSAHGTTGDWMSVVVGGKYKIAELLAQQGLAVLSIDQPLHGLRCGPKTLPDSELEFKTFNFLNIEAGLTNFRQSALDTVYMTRLVNEGKLDVPAGIGPNQGAVKFSRTAVGFIGHSQGGLSGSLAAAVEPNLKVHVFSGAGAGLSLTIVQRVEPIDIPGTLGAILGLQPGELDEFHPVVSLVQALADITDPLVYARLTWERPAGVRPPDVLLTEGLKDQATPHATSEALAASLGLDILAPLVELNPALALGEAQLVSGPVAGNLNRSGFAVTGVVTQWAARDHFAIFNEPKLAAMYPHFLRTALTSDAGEVILP